MPNETQPQKNRMPTANSVASGALIGAPVATVLIWYLNTFIWPGKIPIEIATAAGSVISTVMATFYHVVGQLAARAGLTLTPPPAE